MNWALCTLMLFLAEIAAPPPLHFVNRFHHHADQIRQYLSFNRAWQQHLSSLRNLYPEQESLCMALRETQELHHIWDTLSDAKNDFYTVQARRNALQSLLELLGPDDFVHGIMPPCVPTWRLAWVR